MIDAKLFRFLVVGVVNTLFGQSVIWFSMWALGLGIVPANALGYGCGIVLSFVLNRNWTFNHEGSQLPALLRFLAVNAVAYAANLLVVVVVHRFGVNGYLAQLSGAPFYTAVGYVGSRLFAFRAAPPATS
jgi:putative flippase GtrA